MEGTPRESTAFEPGGHVVRQCAAQAIYHLGMLWHGEGEWQDARGTMLFVNGYAMLCDAHIAVCQPEYSSQAVHPAML